MFFGWGLRLAQTGPNYGGGGFAPLRLFALGEQGAWYDPSDLSTLFQDSAGSTPGGLELPVGLWLDKHKGLVLGSELVVNGGFDTPSNWSLTGGWVISGGSASTGTGGFLEQVVGTLTPGRWYLAEWDSGNTQTINAVFGNTFSLVVQKLGRNRAIGLCGSSSKFALQGGSAYTGIDNISVRELPGHHASQPTAASRPILSARVNLLTKTEQFDDAVWGKAGATVTPNAVVAPDGTMTADKLVENTATSAHFVNSTTQTTLLANTAGTFTIFVKAAERTQVRVEVQEFGILSLVRGDFDLSAKTVVASSVGTATGAVASIQEEGEGWLRLTLSGTPSTGTGRQVPSVRLLPAGLDSYTGDGTSGIYIWGADLRVANEAVTAPAYQRVTTATDYDAVGFPYYLRFDGVDDFLSTASINFTGTDKVSVFAGVRKLSDAAAAAMLELSESTTTNNGSFTLFAPRSAGNYGFSLRGTAPASRNATTYTAPVSNVLSCNFDLSQPTRELEILPKVGGVIPTLTGGDGADAGTGNFGNYPLYIGRRGGTSLPFNGHLYGLIIRGALTDDATTVKVENLLAGKTGVAI